MKVYVLMSHGIEWSSLEDVFKDKKKAQMECHKRQKEENLNKEYHPEQFDVTEKILR